MQELFHGELSIVVNQGEYQYSDKRGNPRKGLGNP